MQARAVLRVVEGGRGPTTAGELYTQHSRYVAAIAWRLLGRDEDVDDVVQDVFLAAHRGFSAVRDVGATKGWLAAITVRTARRKLRLRRLKTLVGLDDVPSYEAMASPDASPEQRAMLAHVYEVLDAMPVEDRIAWCLRYVEGEKLEAVASLCGCSLATAKRRIASAQAVLEVEAR